MYFYLSLFDVISDSIPFGFMWTPIVKASFTLLLSWSLFLDIPWPAPYGSIFPIISERILLFNCSGFSIITLKVVLYSLTKYNLVELRQIDSHTHMSDPMLIYTPAFLSVSQCSLCSIQVFWFMLSKQNIRDIGYDVLDCLCFSAILLGN